MAILAIFLWMIIGAISGIILLARDYRGKEFEDIKNDMDSDFWFLLIVSSLSGVVVLLITVLTCMFEAEIPQKFIYKMMNIGVNKNDRK